MNDIGRYLADTSPHAVYIGKYEVIEALVSWLGDEQKTIDMDIRIWHLSLNLHSCLASGK